MGVTDLDSRTCDIAIIQGAHFMLTHTKHMWGSKNIREADRAAIEWKKISM